MNKKRKLINAFLVSTMLVSSLAPVAKATEKAEDNVARLGGNSRVETSVKVSNEVYDNAHSVVIAGYSGEADALTGTLLASAKKAPLLLVSDQTQDISAVKAEIDRLGADNVFLLGGATAISNKIESALSEYSVQRIKGKDRFATAVAVAKEAANGQNKNHVFLANDGRSGSLADALAAGPVSGKHQTPVLLTSKENVPQTTLTALKDLGVEKITIIGGNAAVSTEVEAKLKKNYEVDRIKGNSRFETAESVAEKYFSDSRNVVLANDGRPNENYTDGLVGGYLGAAKNAPLLLTAPKTLNNATVHMLRKRTTSFAYVIGGASAISSNIENIVSKILIPNSQPVITTKKRTETVNVPYKTTRKNDSTLEIGKIIVQTPGRNGQIEKVYTQTFKDGVLSEEKLTSEKTIQKVINEVILVGTKEKPQGGKEFDINTFDMVQFNKEYLSLINKERARIGRSPLKYNPNLQKGTDIRAEEIRTNYSHTRPNGKDYDTVFTYIHSDPAGYYGENIAQDREILEVEREVNRRNTTFEKVYAERFYELFRTSPGHYANMTNRYDTYFATSIYYQSGAVYNAMIVEFTGF